MKKNKDLEVKEFEVNPLTYIPGGYMLTLEYKDGSTSRGVNIKHPRKYVETVIAESLMNQNELVRVYLSSSKQTIYENNRWYGITDKA